MGAMTTGFIQELRETLTPPFTRACKAGEEELLALVAELVTRDLAARRFRSAIQKAVNAIDKECG